MPGDRTLIAIGIGHERRGLLSHHLFSNTADGSRRESAETQRALTAIGTALAPLDAAMTETLDAGFDDIALRDRIWARGARWVRRMRERDRLVHPTRDAPACHRQECAAASYPLAQVETEVVARTVGQPREKLQAVTEAVAVCPLVLRYRHDARMTVPGKRRAVSASDLVGESPPRPHHRAIRGGSSRIAR